MLLYLVRHAESEGNARLPGAPIDCRLTGLGHEQARAAGQRLAELLVTRVIASPYRRTLETAEHIRRATEAPASIMPLLHEHHVDGFPPDDDWPLQDLATLAREFPHFEAPADFDFAPRWHAPPESEASVLARANRVLAELYERHHAQPGVRLAIVSHGSPTGKLVMAALGAPDPLRAGVRIDNASITIVDYAPDWRVLVACNTTEHLEHLGVPFERRDPGFSRPRG